MRIIDQETDIEVLRAYTKWLIEKNSSLEQKLEEKLNEMAKEVQAKFTIEEQLMILKKKLFDRKSEKRLEASDRERSEDELNVLVHSRSIVPSAKKKDTKSLPEEIIYHSMSATDLEEESDLRGFDRDGWQEIPLMYDESIEITVVERSYKMLIHRRKKYLYKASPGKDVIVTANGPEKLLPGSTYSIDFATSVVSDKYVSHMPLERQTKEMSSLGLKNVGTRTLYGLCLGVGLHLEALAEKIRQEILASNLCVHCDETPWPIQIKEQDDGYMWTMSNQAGSYYVFEPTRSGEVIKNLLEGYDGFIMCDGYTGYNKLKEMGIKLSHCWAHARRKFIEIEDNYPEQTSEVLKLISTLSSIERRAKDFDDLKKLRENESRLVIDQIFKWLTQTKSRPEDGLTKAIEYCLKYWEGLTRFLRDVRVPLTNNEAERTIRHAVMGRKNYYGSRTHNGADLAATLFTIIESCKKVEVDPRTFINMTVHKSAKGEALQTPLEYAKHTRSH